MANTFHNPYNFVPAPRRSQVTGELGDRVPAGHHALQDTLWTGTLKVKLTVVTPLLLTDAARATTDRDAPGHKTYPMRVGPDGAPFLPATSVRGMLRAAYEAVTNSRFGIFEGHDKQLKYRDGGSKQDHPCAPQALLDASLKPARTLTKLSPAERVFGWVNQEAEHEERGAWRGALRVGQVSFTGDLQRHLSRQKKTLAILGQPKPQQTRFYVLATQPKGAKSAPRYDHPNTLRGRKVYPHHELSGDREKLPYAFITERSDQNRSVSGWVKPGASFTFTIHVENLSDVELGALLYLLKPKPMHHMRLGGGKPLGFGSVRAQVDEDDGAAQLARGESWRRYYSSLGEEAPYDRSYKDALAAYKEAMVRAYGDDKAFEELPLIKAYQRACRGFEDKAPTHYPRTRTQHNRSDHSESFRWFMANERGAQPQSLPKLEEEERRGLEYNEQTTQGGRQRR